MPHGQKKRHSSVETIRSSAEVEANARYSRYYDSRSERGYTTTFPHEAGPGLPSAPDIWGNKDSSRTKELLTRISDGICKNKILKGEMEQMEDENNKLRQENERLIKGKASLRGAYNSLRREVEELRSRLKHDLGNEKNDIRREPANTDQGLGWFGAFHGTRSSQMSRDTEVNALRAEITQHKKRIQELATKDHGNSQTIAEQERHIQKQRAEFAQELDDLTGKAFVKGARLSDTEIQTKWKTLGFSIRQFVAAYFPEPLDGQAAQLLAQRQEFTWLPELAMALQAPILYQVTLESWIWHLLCFQVFDSHSTFWAGEVGQTFRIQCDQFRGKSLTWIRPCGPKLMTVDI
jgi:phage shock protein A